VTATGVLADILQCQNQPPLESSEVGTTPKKQKV